MTLHPWHLWVSTTSIRDLVADYYNCMSRLDSMIGETLTNPGRIREGENTIVIYIGDQGATCEVNAHAMKADCESQ